MAKKENKTSIDLVTVSLSEDKINELKDTMESYSK